MMVTIKKALEINPIVTTQCYHLRILITFHTTNDASNLLNFLVAACSVSWKHHNLEFHHVTSALVKTHELNCACVTHDSLRITMTLFRHTL